MTETQLKQELERLYYPLDAIKNELNTRWENKDLARKIREVFNPTPELEILFEKPRMVMFRHVATPTNETIRVAHVAQKLGLELLIIEYLEDKFTPSINTDKYNLGKLPIYNGADINNSDIVQKLNVVDFARMEGNPISCVQTHLKETIPDLHHELLREIIPSKHVIVVDGSKWLLRFKGPSEYYKVFFDLFALHNVIAEIYYWESFEKDFSENIILPAVRSVEAETGYKPLIWNYLDETTEKQEFWNCYPKHVGEILHVKGYY